MASHMFTSLITTRLPCPKMVILQMPYHLAERLSLPDYCQRGVRVFQTVFINYSYLGWDHQNSVHISFIEKQIILEILSGPSIANKNNYRSVNSFQVTTQNFCPVKMTSHAVLDHPNSCDLPTQDSNS